MGPSAFSKEKNQGIHTVSLDRPGVLRKVSDDPRDTRPIWLSDRELTFVRSDDNSNDRMFRAAADGAYVKPLGTSSRTAYGKRVVDGKPQLLVGGDEGMYWFDVETGTETPGPAKPPGYMSQASASPSGTWVVYEMGANNQDVWRVRVGDAPQRVPLQPGAQTFGYASIDDAGNIIGAQGRWYGDLVLVPAKPGEAF
jgi:dipeptidyl aminopeptidase/acylaminoacyl peptidase